MSAKISIVVPTLDEEARITATLARLREPEIREVIVADGGSTDGTREIAAGVADRVIASARGRAAQMNAGAAVAQGEVLLFVHADTDMPAGFGAAIARAMRAPGVVGGCFDVALDDSRLAYRLIGTMISLRSRWTRLFTGDQAIFVRRDVFDRLGGYPEQPLMEDLALSIAMRRAGEIASLRVRVTTSARRWREHGVIRTVLLMWTLRGLYAAGVSPRILARYYTAVR
ncbi:MAG: TIGR04283 family arsenosugar biosynthesis glycosyltransferase [Candidatus Binatia bacterium]